MGFLDVVRVFGGQAVDALAIRGRRGVLLGLLDAEHQQACYITGLFVFRAGGTFCDEVVEHRDIQSGLRFNVTLGGLQADLVCVHFGLDHGRQWTDYTEFSSGCRHGECRLDVSGVGVGRIGSNYSDQAGCR